MSHVTRQEIEAFRARTLDRERIEAVGAHVRECRDCARLVFGDDAVRDAAQSLWKPEPRQRYTWLAAAAAILIAVALWTARDDRQTTRPVDPPAQKTATVPRATATVIRDGSIEASITPTGVEVRTARPEWDAMIAAALRDGTIPVPDRTGLEAPGVVLRGHDQPTEPRLLEPLGIVVESSRPPFRWRESAGRTYRVVIARDGVAVAKSGVLRTSSWTPREPLPRGAIYEWQLIAARGDAEEIIPAPDAPPARFRVLSHGEFDELETARATGSRLLTGLVASRLGLDDVAARELALFAKAHPGTRVAGQRPAPTTTNAAQ
ncbi:MAG TPA: hypothetical protein VEU30_04585 [Thermoanaerobaculia bacterium]|nr:hypothetical protein [Thermoanaerobaculia bacterium]